MQLIGLLFFVLIRQRFVTETLQSGTEIVGQVLAGGAANVTAVDGQQLLQIVQLVLFQIAFADVQGDF